MLGKIEGETRKGQQMLRCVRQHQQLKGDELEQTQGDGAGQWSLECCSPQGCKQGDTTE